jgi:hypothetical protein
VRPLRDRLGQGVHPAAAAWWQVDRQANRRLLAPREDVPKAGQVEEMVGMHVADDDPGQIAGSMSRSSRRTTPCPASSRTDVPSQSMRKPAAGDVACGTAELQPSTVNRRRPERSAVTATSYGPRGPRVDARLTREVSSR